MQNKYIFVNLSFNFINVIVIIYMELKKKVYLAHETLKDMR